MPPVTSDSSLVPSGGRHTLARAVSPLRGVLPVAGWRA